MFRFSRDRNWERELDQIRAVLAESAAINQANSRDLAYLTDMVVTGERETAQLKETVTGLVQVVVAIDKRVDSTDVRLDRIEAAQEQQLRILDYLLQKEQERQNGQ
jgi:septal ring factor EnvC (AmiA/AmiB activator)